VPSVLGQLKAILEVNKKLLTAPTDDVQRLQEWGVQRELIFARIREEKSSLRPEEQAAAAAITKEITESDAVILDRLQRNLAALNQKKTAVAKMQQAIGSSARLYPAVLLRKVA